MNKEKLTDQEIAKVFAMYLEQPVLYNFKGEDILCRIMNIGLTSMYSTGKASDGNTFNSYGLNGGKLLLTPLSKITDEHAQQISNGWHSGFQNLTAIKRWIEQRFNNETMPSQIYQQLVVWGYAVPLWFGIDHCANGKTALDLSLSIEQPIKN